MEITSIEQYLEDYIKLWSFSGIIGVIKNNKIILEKAYGTACHEYSIENTMYTCFSLGSISKQFTAFVVMLLYDKGKIDIYKSINSYLPEKLRIDDKITAHHLLCHTSGLPQFYNWEDDFFQLYHRNTFCREEFFNKYIDKPLNFEPGEKFEYNNAGYNLLAWAIENICDQSFGEVLDGLIFKPLGMNNSVLDDGHNIIKNKAFPYQMNRDEVARCQYYNENFSIGAGAIVTNFYDLCKWYNCLKNRQLLSNKTYDLFLNENKAGYCYGLNHDEIYGRDRYYHGGDHLGVGTYMQNFFDEDICIIVLSNIECGNHYKVGNAIAEILFTGETKKPEKLPKVNLSEEELSKYEGVYLKNKIVLQKTKDGLEFLRFNGEYVISLYPVGNHKFARKWFDQTAPYTLKEYEDGRFEFFGYKQKE